jgi:CcmD family protein
MDQTQFTFLFWAYFVCWFGIVLYVISLVLRERRLRQQLNDLRNQLSDPSDE